jgi:hypothetical protein
MVAEAVEFLSNSLTITVLVAYVFALWAALVVWTLLDVNDRTDNILYKLGAVLIVATGSLLGFAIYLLLRPNTTKEEMRMRQIEEVLLTSQAAIHSCPKCYATIKEEFEYCVSCALKLSADCQNCSKKINIAWNTCPFCGKEGRREALEEPKEEKEVAVASKETRRRILRPAIFSSIAKFIKSRRYAKKPARKRVRAAKATKAKAKAIASSSRKRRA